MIGASIFLNVLSCVCNRTEENSTDYIITGFTSAVHNCLYNYNIRL